METKHNANDQKLSPDGSSELPTQQELYRSMGCVKHLSLASQPCWAPQWFHREQTLLSKHCWFPSPAVSSEQSQSHHLSLPLTLYPCLCSCR